MPSKLCIFSHLILTKGNMKKLSVGSIIYTSVNEKGATY